MNQDTHSLRYFGYDDKGELIQDAMQKPEVMAEIQACMTFLQVVCKPLRSANKGESSYALKHAAERWRGYGCHGAGLNCYVANGSLIAAALICGVPVKRCTGSPNALIGVRPLIPMTARGVRVPPMDAMVRLATSLND